MKNFNIANQCILFKLMPVYLACHRQVLQYYACISNMDVRAYLVVIMNDSRVSYKRFTRTSCGIGIHTYYCEVDIFALFALEIDRSTQWRREGERRGPSPPPPKPKECCRNLVLSSRGNTFGARAEIIYEISWKFAKNVNFPLRFWSKNLNIFLEIFLKSVFSGPNAQNFPCMFLSLSCLAEQATNRFLLLAAGAESYFRTFHAIWYNVKNSKSKRIINGFKLIFNRYKFL